MADRLHRRPISPLWVHAEPPRNFNRPRMPRWVLPGSPPSRVIRTALAVYTGASIVTEMRSGQLSFREWDAVHGQNHHAQDHAQRRAAPLLRCAWRTRCTWLAPRARTCRVLSKTISTISIESLTCATMHNAYAMHNAAAARLSAVRGLVHGQMPQHRRPGERGGSVARARADQLPSICKKKRRRLVETSAAQPAPHCRPAFVFRAVHTPTTGGGAGRC